MNYYPPHIEISSESSFLFGSIIHKNNQYLFNNNRKGILIMSFTLQKLTEGIRDRHVGQQNKRLVEKWSRTGLLRGMDDVHRENMATLLENQAAQVLRESSTMTDGNVAGFSKQRE